MKSERFSIKGFPGYYLQDGKVYSDRSKSLLNPEVTYYLRDGEGKKKRVRVERVLSLLEPYEEQTPPSEKGETFIPVEGFPGYWISNKGRVWSEFRGERFLKPYPVPGRYYYQVYLGGKGRLIHTLVGRNFLPHSGSGFICHKEETLSFPEINFLENLWVGTPSDNHKDSLSKGRSKLPTRSLL